MNYWSIIINRSEGGPLFYYDVPYVDWPEIPKEATMIDARNNLLEYIPEDLPNGIVSINVVKNPIKELPKKLPNKLNRLFMSMERMDKIPYEWPSSLKMAYLHSSVNLTPENTIFSVNYYERYMYDSMPGIKIFNRMKGTYFKRKVYNTLWRNKQMRAMKVVFLKYSGNNIPEHIYENIRWYL